MSIKDIEGVKNPIVYISLTLVFSSIFYGLYNDYLWLAGISASFFIIFAYLNTNLIFSLVLSMFFILGILNNVNYYNLESNDSFYREIKVTEKSNYYYVGEMGNRKIYLEGDGVDDSLGKELCLKGNFTFDKDIEKGILGKLKIDKIYWSKKNLTSFLYDIRENIYKKLKENLGQRKSALVTSVSFGYSEYLDQYDEEEMRNLGVIHAISVSGLHVALVYGIIRKFLGKNISLISTFVYVILTGAAFSSIRAFIMIVVLSISFNLRRNYNSASALALACLLITLAKPYAPFKLGFILSFLASAGIITFSKKLNNNLYRLPNYLRSTISVTLSAQVFTLPIIMIAFSKCSMSFFLGNIIIVPLLNLLIILGNLLILAYSISSLFDFLSYIIINVIKILDILMDSFYEISNINYVVNESMIMAFTMTLISVYFISKGIKKMGILAVAAMISACIYIYSPFLRVDYLKEGGLLISYRGERKIVTNSRNVDMAKLKKITLAHDGVRAPKKIKLLNKLEINSEGKNFYIELKNKKYLLKLNNRGLVDESYDIINFIDKEKKGFFIIEDELLTY